MISPLLKYSPEDRIIDTKRIISWILISKSAFKSPINPNSSNTVRDIGISIFSCPFTDIIIVAKYSSGIRSVASGFQSINSGDSKIVVAGGQESMSLAPHAIHLRDGKKLGDAELIDTMVKDGLWDAFHGYHMGVTAENVATKFQVTRQEQDTVERKREFEKDFCCF